MNVNFVRQEVKDSLQMWRDIDDICFARKVERFIPDLNPTDRSPENIERNRQYKSRAVFYNFAGYTFRGMLGACFAQEPTLKLPVGIEYLAQNADGAGTSIYQQSQSVTGDVIRLGRAGLFVAFPQVDGASRQHIAEGVAVATIHHVPASSIINWRYIRRGSKNILAMVAFTFKDEDWEGFQPTTVLKVRVLRLDDAGIYTDETYNGTSGNWELESSFQPRDGAGNPWREIPFTFVGSENNDASVDPPPMRDIVEINVGHYRNSADYEDSGHYAGQPQWWMSGVDQTWFDLARKQGIYIGSRQLMPVPPGESFGCESSPPNPLVGEMMKEKVGQMVALGARVVDPGSAVKTATQSSTEKAVQHSVLSLIVANVNEAYEAALIWCRLYMNVGLGEECVYKISDEFGIDPANPQMLQALLQLRQSGVLPSPDLWTYLRRTEIIAPHKTDEEIEADLAREEVLPMPQPDGSAI